MSEHGYPPSGDGSSEPPAYPSHEPPTYTPPPQYQPPEPYQPATPYQPTTPHQPTPPYQPTTPYSPPPAYTPPPQYQPPAPYEPAPYGSTAPASTPPATTPYEPGPYEPAPQQAAPYQPAPYQPAPYPPGGATPETAPPESTMPLYRPEQQHAPQPTFPADANNPGGPVYPGYQPAGMATPWVATAPQPKSRKGLIIGLVVVVLVVLCGGGITAIALKSGKKSSTATSTATSGSTAKPKPTATIVSIPAGDGTALKSYLAKMPAGAKKISVSGSKTGIENLDQYMKLHFSKDGSERSILEDRGFRVSAENYWVDKTGLQVNTQLLQFTDSTGAKDQAVGQKGAFADDASTSSQYALPGVSHGAGFEKDALDKYGERNAVLMCQDGPIYIVIFFYTKHHFDRAAELAILKRQVAALTP